MDIENNDFIVADIIKDVFKEQVSEKIDEEIDKKVKEFREKLINQKEDYIAEIVKSIKIYSERTRLGAHPEFRIVFENVYKIEE